MPKHVGRAFQWLKNAAPALGIMGLCLAAALVFSLSMGPRALELTREGGVIETLTVAFYALVLAGAVWLLTMRKHGAAGLVAFLALMMGLREMDAHKAFTTYGVFKTRLYVSPDVPLAEKLIAGAVVIGLLVLLVLAVRSAWKAFARQLSPAALTLIGVGVFGLFLKEMDGLPRQLKKLGLALEPQLLAVSKAIEETGELGLPVLLGLALVQLSRQGGQHCSA